jgi:hypothetical protein
MERRVCLVQARDLLAHSSNQSDQKGSREPNSCNRRITSETTLVSDRIVPLSGHILDVAASTAAEKHIDSGRADELEIRPMVSEFADARPRPRLRSWQRLLSPQRSGQFKMSSELSRSTSTSVSETRNLCAFLAKIGRLRPTSPGSAPNN